MKLTAWHKAPGLAGRTAPAGDMSTFPGLLYCALHHIALHYMHGGSCLLNRGRCSRVLVDPGPGETCMSRRAVGCPGGPPVSTGPWELD